MPRTWVARRAQLVALAEQYLHRTFPDDPGMLCSYADILEQTSWFEPSVLMQPGGIEKAMLACDALFHESCGFKFVVDEINQVIIRDLPRMESLAPLAPPENKRASPWDFNKEHFVSQALGLLEASFHYIDRVLPVVLRSEKHTIQSQSNLNHFKRELINLVTGFAHLAVMHDCKPILVVYFKTFCKQLVHRMKQLVNEDDESLLEVWSKKALRKMGLFSKQKEKSMKKSLEDLRVLAPLSYQTKDVITLDRELGTYTAHIAMTQPEPKQYIEFAVVLLYEAFRAEAFTLLRVQAMGEKIQQTISQELGRELAENEKSEIQRVLDASDASRSGRICIYQMLPDWYQRSSNSEHAFIVPHLKHLLAQERWIVPARYPEKRRGYPLLPPRNYFFYEFGWIDLETNRCHIVHDRVHAGSLTRGSQSQAQENIKTAVQDAEALDRKLSLETLVSPLRGVLKKLHIKDEPDRLIVDVLSNCIDQHNLHKKHADKIRLRNLPIYEKNINRLFGHAQHKRVVGAMYKLGEYLLKDSIPSFPQGLVKSIGIFLTLDPKSAGNQYFWMVRSKLLDAVYALHCVKRGFAEGGLNCTQDQIILLEAMMAYKTMEINQFYKKNHKVDAWVQRIFDLQGFEALMDHVPLPSVVELTPGSPAGVHYDQWRGILSGIMDRVKGAFKATDKLCITQCKMGRDRTGYLIQGDIFLNSFYWPQFKFFLKNPASEKYFGFIPTVVHMVPLRLYFPVAATGDAEQLNERLEQLGSILRHSKEVENQLEHSKEEFLRVQSRVVDNGEMAFMAGYTGGTRGCLGFIVSALKALSKALPYFYKLFLIMARFNKSIKQSTQMMPELLATSKFHAEFSELARLLKPDPYRRLTAGDIYHKVLQKIVQSEEAGAIALVKKVAIEMVFQQVKSHLSFYELTQLYQLLHLRSKFTEQGGMVARLLHQPLSEAEHFRAKEALFSDKQYRSLDYVAHRVLSDLRGILLRQMLASTQPTLQDFLKSQKVTACPESPHLFGLSPEIIYSILKPYPGDLQKMIRKFPELLSAGWADQRSLWQKMSGSSFVRPALEGFIDQGKRI